MDRVDPERSKDYISINTMEEQEGKYRKCKFYNDTFIHIEVCERKCKALIAYSKMQIAFARLPHCARDQKLEERFIVNKRKGL